MANPTFVQKNTSAVASGATIPYSGNNTLGNMLFAAVRLNSVSAANTIAITDSAGNTWIQIGALFTIAANQPWGGIFYVPNCKAGANTLTVSNAAALGMEVDILEYSGVALVSPLDQTTNANATSVNANSGNITTTSSNELLLGIALNTNTPATGFTWLGGFTERAMDATMQLRVADLDVNSIGTYASTGTWASSSIWIQAIVSFKSAVVPLVISTTSLPSATQNVPYSATLVATGGTSPYTWAVTVGSLPAGLTLNSSTGVISGTPTGVGISTITIQVTDASSATATQVLSLGIGGLIDPQVSGTASLSLPLQPFRESLTIIPGSGQFGNNASLENEILNGGSTPQSAQAVKMLTQSGNQSNRLV